MQVFEHTFLRQTATSQTVPISCQPVFSTVLQITLPNAQRLAPAPKQQPAFCLILVLLFSPVHATVCQDPVVSLPISICCEIIDFNEMFHKQIWCICKKELSILWMLWRP